MTGGIFQVVTIKSAFVQSLLATAMAITPGFVAAQPATQTGQDGTTQAAPDDTASDIVVTGSRASARAAVKAKRNASVIMDAVAQDQVGRLPDLNIVEASRRIAGVSVVGGADATKNRDIYQRATIRGLDPRYNLVTIDDVPLASPDWVYRGARLEMLPAALVSRIEAIKTVTAQYDPHALGGQINIVSKSAFDQDRRHFLVVNAYGGLNDTAGKLIRKGRGAVRADATAATVFGADGQFGIVMAAEYQRLPSTARANLPGDTFGAGWTYFTAAGARTQFPARSTGSVAPVRNQDYFFENLRTRASGNLKLEWRPDDATALSLFGGYYHDKDVETRNEMLTQATGAPTAVTASSGTFAQADVQQGLVYQPVTRDTWMVTAKGHHAFTDHIVLDGTLARSKAIYRETREMIKWDTSPRAGAAANLFLPAAGYGYTIKSDGTPALTFANPGFVADPASYKALYFRDIARDLDSTVDFARINIGLNAAPDDRGFGVNVGGALTRTDLSYDQRNVEYVPATTAAQAAIGGLGPVTYAARPLPYQSPQLPYLLIDRAKAWAVFDANRLQFLTTNQIANNAADDFSDRETTKAVYAQGLFRGERLTVQAGVRYDATDLTIDTNAAPTIAGTTAYTPQRRRTDYDFVLPSALATYQIDEQMRLRAGVSKTIGRPDYGQYAARTSFGVATNGQLTINTGNPGLRPRQAWNYDLSYEYYLGNGGLIAVAAFAKEIKDEIFTSTQAGPATVFNGVTYTDVVVNTPLNAAAARVKGLEFSFSQDRLPIIPGLGINANLTLLDGSFDQPVSRTGIAAGSAATRRASGLIQQPDYMANLTLFYTRGPIDVRASYNRIGRALQSSDGDTPTRDLYQEPRQQLDLQARYTLVSGVEIVGQIQNLTKEPFVVRQGAERALLNYYFPVGRTVWLGLSWKPRL